MVVKRRKKKTRTASRMAVKTAASFCASLLARFPPADQERRAARGCQTPRRAAAEAGRVFSSFSYRHLHWRETSSQRAEEPAGHPMSGPLRLMLCDRSPTSQGRRRSQGRAWAATAAQQMPLDHQQPHRCCSPPRPRPQATCLSPRSGPWARTADRLWIQCPRLQMMRRPPRPCPCPCAYPSSCRTPLAP